MSDLRYDEAGRERVAFVLGMLQGSLTELHDTAESEGSDRGQQAAARMLKMVDELKAKLYPGMVDPGFELDPRD